MKWYDRQFISILYAKFRINPTLYSIPFGAEEVEDESNEEDISTPDFNIIFFSIKKSENLKAFYFSHSFNINTP